MRRMIERLLVCLVLLTAIFAGSAAASAGSANIVVFVYNDTIKNGRFDAGEQGLANWTIKLIGGFNWRSPIGTIPGHGTSPVLPTPLLRTNATGYNITTVSPGTYFLVENEQNWVNGWVPSPAMPDGSTVRYVTVTSGDVKHINFSVYCHPGQTCAPHT